MSLRGGVGGVINWPTSSMEGEGKEDRCIVEGGRVGGISPWCSEDCVWIIFSFGFLSVCTPPVSSSTADPILVLLLFFYYFMRPFDKDGLASYSLSA